VVTVVNTPSNNNRPRRALLVVADAGTRQLCNKTLGEAGFAVANGIESGIAAVAAARAQRPDIILLSQQLSDVPAPEAVKWLRANPDIATTPIIILGGKGESTGFGNRERITTLSRPITAAHIRSALVEVLASQAKR
jgi:CheY-like chemotaxis protein